jgi:hypothetical protein
MLLTGALGLTQLDGEAIGLGAGVIGGLGLLTGPFIAGMGPRFSGDGETPALADRIRLSSLSLHGAAIKPREHSIEPAAELRLSHEGLVRDLGIGGSILQSMGSEAVLVASADVRYFIPVGAVRSYIGASLQYTSWRSATPGNRDKALALQGALGVRIHPAGWRIFGEVEARYAHRLVLFEGDDREGFLGANAGVGLVF